MPIRFLLLLTLCIATADSLYAQSTEFVPTQGITSLVHQKNRGKIIFTAREVAPNALKSTDFLTTYELTNKSDLFITVFMATSLTNYLHVLAPTLNVDSLTKRGNYQFSFLVDSHLIYQSNLHPGAPYPHLKNNETVVSKPLIDNQHEGSWWSQSAWNRFMNNGGGRALTEGHHLFRLEIRPYINLTEVKVGDLIAAGELALDVKRKPQLQLARIKLSVPTPYRGFKVSTESFDRDKMKALKGNIEADVFKHITSVVVIKNGKLLIEEYFNKATRHSLHDVRSVGKSFASTLAGIAHQEGYLKSERQPLADFYDLSTFANYSTAKAQTTVVNLLTMSSEFDGDDSQMDSPGNEENMYPTANWVKFALDLPVKPTKFRGQWHYFTAGVVLLGDILNKLVPGQLDTYSRRKLFSPLGIINYKWQYTPQGVVNTAGGIQMNTLDFAKYGQLYKNGGQWNGHQLVPADWVAKTFTKHKDLPDREDEYYGYLFWNKTYHIGGKAYETYYCTGNGGNKIFIFKDQPLVVVVTATAYNTYYAHPQVDRMMEAYILPAVLR